MSRNNNLSVLPFYQSLAEQNHKKAYAFGNVYCLATPLGWILPFQIVKTHEVSTTLNVKLYKFDGTLVADITTAMNSSGLAITQYSSLQYDVVSYIGTQALTGTYAEGRYYLVVTAGTETFYSDIFTYVSDMSGYLKIEWHNHEDITWEGGRIIYTGLSSQFRNRLYLQTELGKPEYPFEEDGEERDGFFFPEKQISEKTYRCVALAPEYLCDCTRLIRMHDYVFVTDQYGRQYDCDTFLCSVEWLDQGDLASLTIEFQTDTVVKNIGRYYVT